MEMIKNSLTSLGVVVICGVVSIATAYISSYMKKLAEKVKAETAKLENQTQRDLTNKAVDRLNQLILVNVIKAQETIVKEIKEKAIDGSVNKEELKEVANVVKADVLVQASEDVKNLVNLEIKDLESYVSAQIEVSLANLKK